MTNVARTGQTLLVVASSMLFAAVTSAMVVRRGIGGDWVAPELPACRRLQPQSASAR